MSATVLSSKYYQEILDEHPPFTPEEETEFRERMLREGRIKELKDELVLRNVGLVSIHGKSWVWLYSPDDAVSIGITGLYEAADAFDFARKDVRFATFAGWYLMKVFHRNKKAVRNDVDEASLRYDRPIEGDDGLEGAVSLGEFLQDLIPPEYLVVKDRTGERMDEAALRKWVEDAVMASTRGKSRSVKARAAAVLLAKIDNPELTLEEIGDMLPNACGGKGVTRERARQLLGKAHAFLTDGAKQLVRKRLAAQKDRIIAERMPGYRRAHKVVTRSRLVWKAGKYVVEDYQEDVTDREELWRGLDAEKNCFEGVVAEETDKYLSRIFGKPFKHGSPVFYRHVPKDVKEAKAKLIGGKKP